MTGIEAVIFDWGGTLTQWHDIDFHEESLALAQAVRTAGDDDHPVNAERLHRAGETIWGWSRDHQRSATIDDLFTEAGLEHDPELLTAYFEFWEPHTLTDPDVVPMLEELRAAGHQDRHPVQHHLAARVAPPRLRARRGAAADRRRRLHLRDPVDQAVAARVPGGHGRRRRHATRPGASTSATASSTTCGAPTTPGCWRSTCRTATSRRSRSGTPRGSRTGSSSGSPTCLRCCRQIVGDAGRPDPSDRRRDRPTTAVPRGPSLG